MRRLVLLVAIAACRPPVQGSGKPAHDVRQVDAFDGLDVAGALDVDVTVGSAQQVTIDGDDNIVPLVKTEVTRRVLEFRTDGSYHPQVPLIAHVEMPSVLGVIISGAGHVHVQGIAGGDVVLSVRGAGKLTASGSAHQANIELSGAGSVDGDALHTEIAKVVLSGAGSVDIYASQSLNAVITGTGSVHYSGHPAQIDKQISGAGLVEAR